jgi:sulfite exporter TauE/SafE
MSAEESLLTLFSAGISVCSAAAAANGPALGGLFLTGLIGSLTHCSGMCGPFVLSQVSARLEAVPAARLSEWHRLTGAALIPYHLGRATTYALLGALTASVLGRVGGGGGHFRWIAATFLGLAALMLLSMAVPGLKALFGIAAPVESWWGGRVARLARPLFRNPVGLRGWALGVALGFIPCGLLYAALTTAAATGDPLAGALGMLAFVAGTIPALIVVGVIGHAAMGWWRAALLRWAPLLLVANAGILGLLALSVLSPA